MPQIDTQVNISRSPVEDSGTDGDYLSIFLEIYINICYNKFVTIQNSIRTTEE